MSLYIKQGLNVFDLEDIHQYLIEDYNYTKKEGLLCNFMALVRNAKYCWGLFEDNDGYEVCVGFAYVTVCEEVMNMELFSIHPLYRRRKLGRSFALTLIDHYKQLQTISDVKLTALHNSVKFWEKIGFIVDEHHRDIMMEFYHQFSEISKLTIKMVLANKYTYRQLPINE